MCVSEQSGRAVGCVQGSGPCHQGSRSLPPCQLLYCPQCDSFPGSVSPTVASKVEIAAARGGLHCPSWGDMPLPCARHLLWLKEQLARLPCQTLESRARQWGCRGVKHLNLTTWLGLERADPKGQGRHSPGEGECLLHTDCEGCSWPVISMQMEGRG